MAPGWDVGKEAASLVNGAPGGREGPWRGILALPSTRRRPRLRRWPPPSPLLPWRVTRPLLPQLAPSAVAGRAQVPPLILPLFPATLTQPGLIPSDLPSSLLRDPLRI